MPVLEEETTPMVPDEMEAISSPEEEQIEPEAEYTEEEMKLAATRVMKEFKVYEKSTISWRKEIQEIWKAMNGELSANVYPWENPQFIPKMRTEISFVTPFVFSGDPEMEVSMIGDEDKEAAFLLDKIISYRIEKNVRTYASFLAWVSQGVGLGTSYLKTTWEFKPSAREGGRPKDRPKYAVPNILDVYTNPMIAEVEDQVSVIEKISMSVTDIKNSELFNERKLLVTPASNKDKNYGSEGLALTDITDQESLDNEFEMVTLYERWSETEITTVADCAGGPFPIRHTKNPYGYIPYTKFIFEKEIIPNRCNGKGVGQNTIGIQEMYYDLFNMVMLNLKIIVNKMWRIDPGSRINPTDLIGRPGGTVRATKDEAEPIDQTDLKGSSFDMLNLLSDEHKRASGATELIQGSSSSRTLGQDQLAQSNVSNRFELVRRGLKAAISDIGHKTLQMELTNLQSPDSEIMQIFPMTERQTVFQILQELAKTMDFDVSVRGDTVVASNKDVMAKQLLDLFNLIGEKLTPQEQRTFAQEIAKLKGVQDVKGIIPDAQMPQPGQIDPATGQPMVDPTTGMPMQQQGPMDGNALPEIKGGLTNQGINEQTYGGQQGDSY